MSEDITALRLQLRAAGYAPVPVTGKRALMPGWSEKFDASPDEIALWSKLYPDQRNTGVLTRLMPAVDIDLLNPEAAEAVEQLARARFEEHGHIMARFGLAPKRAIPLRTDKPFKKIACKLIAPSGKAGQKSKFSATASRSSSMAFTPTHGSLIAGLVERRGPSPQANCRCLARPTRGCSSKTPSSC